MTSLTSRLLRLHAGGLLGLGQKLDRLSVALRLQRRDFPILLFFHGYALAHTIRPIVLARALRARGYPVVLAGRGPHTVRVRQEGFTVHDVETMPQSRMDQFVSRGDYQYYNMEWVDRCVASERTLIGMIKPALIIHDMKPTAALSSRLEGVDDARITQAYNQPGFPEPIHLPDFFPAVSGPFDEYLARHAAQVRPQKSFNLLADIPEFHPPGKGASGYHYVGPLLDRPAEPDRLEVLDEGWDVSLPLIYLTCGSSGTSPTYMDDFVAAIRERPYRVLITTAGRWSPRRGHDRGIITGNVRVVNFLPGEWILRRAEMLVGIVGIGAVYQALANGVPVIGAPDHLDQEYHLNRVQTLGLGIKLDRRDFTAHNIVAAIDKVMADVETYRARCAPLREALAAYPDGSLAVDLLDSYFASKGEDYRADSRFLTTAADFAEYLDVSTPSTLGTEAIRDILSKAILRGMPHRWQGERLLFDQVDSWNWLYDHDPRFFGADYKGLEEKRRQFFVADSGDDSIRSRDTWVRYRATYRYRIYPQGSPDHLTLAPGQRLKVFLPYPIERPGHQRDVQLVSCSSGLAEVLAPKLGFFYGLQVEVGKGAEPLEFTYTCELRVSEQGVQEVFKTELGERDRGRCLELDPTICELPEVRRFRQRLGFSDETTDEEKARAIYRDLVDNKRFKKTKDCTQNPKYSTAVVLSNTGGHCRTLARAFASLCRAEGIPTREVSGALIGYPDGRDRYANRNYCQPIFGHTWIEIHLHSKGWVPVEFHGIVVAAGAMTKDNVKDKDLRRLIQGNSRKYLDYYFGHVDNQRVICSNSVKQISQCLLEDPDRPEGDRKRWQAAEELRYDCSLEVECL